MDNAPTHTVARTREFLEAFILLHILLSYYYIISTNCIVRKLFLLHFFSIFTQFITIYHCGLINVMTHKKRQITEKQKSPIFVYFKNILEKVHFSSCF